MSVYRRPFLKPGEDRRPTLTFPREILIGGKPEHMVPVIEGYSSWMAQNEVPKLFINGDPGAIIFGDVREFCRRWKNQKEVTVRGKHYLQEDSPNEIGNAIVEWLGGL
jgi:haloalkane dehalogenase